jgi:type III secretion system HrpE/YscL family protein
MLESGILANKVIKQGPGAYPPPGSAGPRPGFVSVRSNVVDPRAPKKPIIQKERVEAKQEAGRIVGGAEQQAAQVIDKARADAEEIYQRAHDEGYQEGLGRHAEATLRAIQEVQRWKAAIEPEYIGLVKVCVEKILGQELKMHPDAIVGIVRNTLRDATQQREITVRVNPEDAEALRKNSRRLLDVLARANNIEVREDPTIARGGCVIITELGTIDASLDRQLKAIAAALDVELNNAGDPLPEEEEGEQSSDAEEGY